MIKNYLKAAALCGWLVVPGGTAQAGISFSSGGSLTNWNGTPMYVSLTNGSPLANASTGQGYPTNITSAGVGVMSELFTPSSSFALASFNILCTVNTAANYEVHLYDLGPAGTVSAISSVSYTPAGIDLFSGLSIALPTTGGEVQGSFALDGADQVPLAANEQYALEIWAPGAAGPTAFLWNRNNGTSYDPGGQMFLGTNSASTRRTPNQFGQTTGTPRVAALALYALPPTITPPPVARHLSVPIFLSNGDVGISYSGSSGRTYVMEWADSLTPPVTWMPLVTNIADSSALLKYTNTPAGWQRFYRVHDISLPGSVTNLTATPGNTLVSLSWSAAAFATSYNVKSATTSGGPYTTITNITTTSFINTGLANDTTYYFVVSALNPNGESVDSPESSATPTLPPPPPVPTGLAATAGDSYVSLSWTASAGALNYNVKTATASGGPYTTITNVTTTSFLDTNVVNGTTYYFVVSALNAYRESANSPETNATPMLVPPPVPTGVRATAGDGSVSLSWTASFHATGYNVKNALTSGGPYIVITNVATTNVVCTGLTNDVTYYFVVSALNVVGESTNSPETNATPASPSTLVYSVENRGTNYPAPPLPTLGHLRFIQPLPDPFTWANDPLNTNGTRSTNFSDWSHHRAEFFAQYQNYEIGIKPAVDPSQVTGSYTSLSATNGTLTVNITNNGQGMTLTCPVSLPSGSGPFPAIIGMNSPNGSVNPSLLTGVATITYFHNQVTTYGNPQNTDPFFRLYGPARNTTTNGQYSAWAWGVSRIVDGLYQVTNSLPIDLQHIGVTGCSYAGKMALFAGAMDERVALTIAQESGGGGGNSWRYNYTEPAGTVEDIDNTDYNWFADQMRQFGGANVSYLPEDHHLLCAMVAPRALFVSGNPGYTWLGNPSCYVCCRAVERVYTNFGIADRFGYNIIGGHNHCATTPIIESEMGAFINKFLLGQTNVNTLVRDVDLTISNSVNYARWTGWWGTTNAIFQ